MTWKTLAAGPLLVKAGFQDGKLRSVDLPQAIPDDLDSKHLASIIEQLRQFSLELGWASEFQRKVWHCLQRIPWGSALTYGEVADEVGSPRAVRAIGQACGANRLPLIIPCHRVLAENGIGGFALGLEWKQTLLELEAAG